MHMPNLDGWDNSCGDPSEHYVNFGGIESYYICKSKYCWEMLSDFQVLSLKTPLIVQK